MALKRAIVVAAMLAGAGGSAAAEERSIHLMPPGTVVKERFTLIDKSVPLPEGEFVFVASQVRDATHVKGEWIRQRVQLITVYLAQLDGEELRAEVLATTVLDPRFTYSKWEDEPCNREDTLFRLDLSHNRGYQQNCLQVNHITNIYTRQPPGIYSDAYVWLQRRGARLPVEVPGDGNAHRSRRAAVCDTSLQSRRFRLQCRQKSIVGDERLASERDRRGCGASAVRRERGRVGQSAAGPN